MPVTRLFVSYGDFNRVFSVHFTETTSVADVKQQLSARLSAELDKEVVLETLFVSSYSLGGADNASEVLRDGDHVKCIDRAEHVEEIYKKSKYVYDFSRSDYVDDVNKSIAINRHPTLGLFLTSVVKKKRTIRFIKRQDIINAASNKLEYDIHWNGSHISAEWWFEEEAFKGIKLRIKTASDDNYGRVNFPLTIDDDNIVDGDASEVIEEKEKEEEKLDLSQYHFPAPEKTGSEIDLSWEPPTINPAQVSGDSLIRLSHQDEITANQGWGSGDNQFPNHFFINLLASNTDLSHDNSLVNPVAYYEKDGEWAPAEVMLGSPYCHSWFDEKSLNVHQGSSVSFGVRVTITVTGNPGSDYSRRQRAHDSLPSPLKIKVGFEDLTGKRSEVIVEFANKRIDFISTREELESSAGVKFDAFVFCDNLSTLQRISIALFRKDSELNVQHRGYDGDGCTTTYSYTTETLRRFVFQAIQGKSPEIEMDIDGWSTSYERGIKLWALVDIPKKRIYGFKVHVVGLEGSATEHVPFLPLDASA